MSSFEFIAIACRAVMFQTVSVPAEPSKTSSQPPAAMWMQHSTNNMSTQETHQQVTFNEYPSLSNSREQQPQTVGGAPTLLHSVATEPQPSYLSVRSVNHQNNNNNLQQNSLTYESVSNSFHCCCLFTMIYIELNFQFRKQN